MKRLVLLVIIVFYFSLPAFGEAELHSWQKLTGMKGGTGPTKIILVHGFQPGVLTEGLLRTLPVDKWMEMAEAILQNEKLAGKVEIYAFLYQPYFDDISTLAREFEQEIEEAGIKENDLIIIAHSMGGLIARHYTNFLEGHKTVKGIFTLGSPHMGIALPFATENLVLGPAILDMQGTPCLLERYGFLGEKGGNYLQDLNNNENFADLIYSFSGRLDPGTSRNLLSYVGEAYYQLLSSLRVPGDGILSNYSSHLEGAHNFPPIEGVYHHDLFQNPQIISGVIAGIEGLLLGEKFQVTGRIKGKSPVGLEGLEILVGEEIVVSDSQGFFRAPGKYDFGTKISPKSREGVDFSPPYQMVDGRKEEYDLLLKETYSLGGKINTIFAENDLEGASLIISSIENHFDFFNIEVGEKGAFYLEDVPEGNYRFFLFNRNRPGLSFREIRVEESDLDLEISFFYLFNTNNN